MPTPDIIVKFRKMLEARGDYYTQGDTAYLRTGGVLYRLDPIESFLLQALTDREAEIVAGIEKMKKGEAHGALGTTSAQELNNEWDAALKEIATKITKGEI